MSDKIELPNDLSQKLNQGMRQGDAIELPFPVAYIWALNGQASYKGQAKELPALYYGGWAAKVADMQAVCEAQGLDVPAGWASATISARDGGEFDAFTARSVLVAPFGKRVSWLLDGRRYPDYQEGARRHLQVLGYLAERKGKNGSAQIIPWGPVVLTAKGFQAKNLLAAFKTWEKATGALLRKVASGVPAWCFYMALGTFAAERKVENVGQPGAQSPITPLTCFVPPDLDEARFSSLFVGVDTAAIMGDLQDQAAEWLGAWKTPVVEGAEQAANAGGDDFFYGSQPEDEIPF